MILDIAPVETPGAVGPPLDRAGLSRTALMSVQISFGTDQLDFEVPADRLVGVFTPPASLGPEPLIHAIATGFESPIDYPALRQAVVPGDRVVLAVDPATPRLRVLLDIVIEILRTAGVEPGAIRVLCTGLPSEGVTDRLPEGVTWTVHDPDEPADIAYLASTEAGRRVYLNKHLIDADIVVPIAPLSRDRALGLDGPWGLLYPRLSNRETLTDFAALARQPTPEHRAERPALAESRAVSHLLGTELQCAVVPGSSGPSAVLVGQVDALQPRCLATLRAGWSFAVEHAADLVVIGVGSPERPADFQALGAALASAGKLVRRGGKIAVLSDLAGEPGPAVQRLQGLDDPQHARAALKGSESEPDYRAARQLADAVGRATIYLWSGLDESLVEELGLVALGAPREARKLVAGAGSCLLLSQADRVRVRLTGDDADL